MTRRLTLTLALVVLAAVTVSTLLTLTAGAARARSSTSDQVAETARVLVQRGSQAAASRDRLPAYCNLASVSRAFRLESISCVAIEADGTLRPLPVGAGNRTLAYPAEVLPRRIELDAVAAGDVLTGVRARQVWALLPILPDEVGERATPAVVVLRTVENPVSALGVRWLVISGLLTTLAGVLAAWLLGRRLSAPLRRATAATHDLAAGQLDVRLPVDERAGAGDELVDLSRSINALGESLQRSRGLEQRFLLSVSHDLRTPLTSIRGYADALADGTLTDVAKGSAVIQQEAMRLERLVRDLLDLAKLDARAFRFELQRVDLATVASGLADALGPDAQRVGVDLRAAGSAGVVVHADPDRVAQVVANLVENALKFAISQVVVSVEGDGGPPGAGGVLRVIDDGPGIAEEDLPHVFERLYVAKRTPARKEAGSGLGLAIVRELVEAMGGKVRVEPAIPRGTCFAVWLPGPAGSAGSAGLAGSAGAVGPGGGEARPAGPRQPPGSG